MANKVRNLHRLTGVAGSPGAVEPSGVVAINFGPAGTPELWGSDGSAWKQLNPAGSISYSTSAQIITGTDTTTALNPSNLSGASVLGITAGAGDAGKYLRLDATGKISSALISPGVVAASAGAADAGKLAALDAAGKLSPTMLDAATAAEIAAGTAGAGVVTADLLALASVKVFGSTADDGKYVRVTNTGKIDPTLLPASAMEYKGATAATGAAPGTPDVGDVYLVSTAGSMAASWTGIGGSAAAVGDQLIWDGAAWSIIRKDADLTAYLPLAGTAGVAGASMTSGALIKFLPAAAGNVVLDANFGAIDNSVIDCGTF